jgi:hypothetical protein
MNKRKKIMIAVIATMGVLLITKIPAQAQLSSTMSSTISSTSSPASTTPASSTAMVSSTVTTITSVGSPIYVSNPGAGYIQLNGLTISSIVSSGNMPVQILATSPDYPTQLITLNTSGATVLPSTVMTPTTCEEFTSDAATTGMAITCPIPPVASAPSVSTSTITPSSTSFYYDPYTLVVNAATNLLLSDRSSASIGDLVPGDQINVYGYYSNGTIDAEVIRDLSRSVGTSAIGSTISSSSSSAMVASTLQSEINQLEALVLQLAAELSVNVTTSTTATSTVSSTTTSCPMIPYSSSTTSTISGCMTASSTGSTTIYQ